MKKITFSNRFWIPFITLAVMSLVFAYYFFIYAENRKESFIDRRYRVLTRMGNNALELRADITKAVNNEWQKILKRMDSRRVTERLQELAKQRVQLSNAFAESFGPFDVSRTRLDSIRNALRRNKTETDTLEHAVNQLVSNPKSLQHGLTGFTLGAVEADSWKRRFEHPDTISFRTFRDQNGSKTIFSAAGFHDDTESSGNNAPTPCFHTHITTILSRLGATSEIEDYLLIRSFTVGYDTKQGQDSVVNKLAYQTLKNKVRLVQLDSLLQPQQGLQTGGTTSVMINGEDYVVLPHRIHFESDEDWIICLLIKEENLRTYSRSLELWIVFNSLLIAFFILIAMPTLKLVVMSPVERLRVSNVWFTGFSLCVGTSLLTLLVLGLYHYFGHYRQTDHKLTRLANAVENKFSDELTHIHDQLKLMDREYADLVKNNWKEKGNRLGYVANNEQLAKALRQAGLNAGDTAVFRSLLSNPYFNEIIWIDKDGTANTVLATHTVEPNETFPNLTTRSYFSKVVNEELWPLPSSQQRTGQFALQSMRSWLSSVEEAGFTIPVKDSLPGDKSTHAIPALLMATTLYSVMETVLPPGYHFCIIDKTGEVQFHSRSNRNVQENFLEETGETQLVAAVAGRLHVNVDAHYYDQSIRVHMQPIKNTGLFLVTFHDQEYYKSPLVLTLGYAFTLIIFLYFIQGVQQLLLFLLTYRPTRLNMTRFYLNWMRPIPDDARSGGNKPAKDQYRRSIKTQLYLIAAVIIAMFLTHDRWLALCLIILPAYLFLYHVILLKGSKLYDDDLARDAQANINATAGLTDAEKQRMLRRYHIRKQLRHPFTVATIVLIILCNLFGYVYLDSPLMALAAQAAIVLLLAFGERIVIPFVDKQLERFCYKAFPKPYITCMVFWLLLSGALPVIYSYKCGYYEELQVWNRYMQLESAFRASERDAALQHQLKQQRINLTRNQFEEIEGLGNYIEATGDVQHATPSTCFTRMPESAYYDLLFKIAPITSERLDAGRSAVYPQAHDRQWRWFTDGDATIMLHFNTVNKPPNSESPPYYFASTVPNFTFSNSDYLLIFLVCLAGLVYLVYCAVKYAVHQIFGIGLLRETRQIENATSIMQMVSGAVAGKRSLFGFVIGLPNSGKSWLTQAICRSYPDDVHEVNFRDADPFVYERKTIFIIRHFEAGINNHEQNKTKLNLLYSLVDAKNKVVLILSSIQPSMVLDFYDKKMRDLQKLDTTPEITREILEYKESIRQWNNLFRDFNTWYMPLQNGNREPAGMSSAPNAAYVPANSFLSWELDHGSFLSELKGKFRGLDLSNYQQREEVVLAVEEMADSYYTGLWNSFSNEEKMVLFDLAKDRFVNTRNVFVLRSLLQKGVITRDDSIAIMNKSFNDFIIRTVKGDEELEIQKMVHQQGKWHSLQIILFLVFVGIALVIAISEERLMQNFNAFLTAAGGITALLLRFSGVFGGGDKQRS